MSLRGKVVLGDFFHAPTYGAIDVLAEALVSIDEAGRIDGVYEHGHAAFKDIESRAQSEGRLLALGKGRCVLPGFVDLHVHAPQYPQLGQALDAPLEVWLEKYTFPLEARYADTEFAKKSYALLVADLLAAGTTTALYFATVHLEATKILADLCLAGGQRALVGKVVMDHPDTCPSYYRDAGADAALADTRALIEYIQAHPGNAEGRVLPAITPRFVPSCTDAALEGLGAIARETGCHVQTHCSESDWAHGHVLERMGKSDTATLDGYGLLARRSVLAHANFMSEDDFDLMVQSGASIAHCALSNAYFAGAVFPLKRALEKGVRVGLGTDVSGGPTHSMFEATRMTLHAARMLEAGVDSRKPASERGVPGSAIDFATAFHLATAGGGNALELPVGTFEVGMNFDAMVVNVDSPHGTIRAIGDITPEELLQKIVYSASRPNIADVYVGGDRVAGAGS
ncbi:guanine deaminase [Pelagibacterium xiamenense]|uniref:guanine deaminase n=1 Tax=Pelagibacterium xiamenense TaxID=2901140 RepID=UPI001E416CC7|nr:guanine deaminase [Pelagibacterium xiamenense]MCD7060721.1 guanine deaminase [Pelagibacterium xiamenense]